MDRLLHDPQQPKQLPMKGLVAAGDAVEKLLPLAAADAPLVRVGGRDG